MTKRLLLFAVLATLLAAPASAAPAPDNATLDAAASWVAGHPVTVSCELDWPTFLSEAQAHGLTGVGGFTTYLQDGSTVVYVAPDVCEQLLALDARKDVGTFFAADALLTLAHESVHQRGVADEGVADCTALSLVKDMAIRFFGIPATTTMSAVKQVWKRLNGRRVHVPTMYTRTIANPFVARLQTDAELWHQAKPQPYQGGC